MKKRRLQLLGSFSVGFLLIVGTYLLIHDLRSFIAQQRTQLVRTTTTLAQLIPASLSLQTIDTKNSQSSNDSQLKEILFRLRDDLRIAGQIYVFGPNQRLLGATEASPVIRFESTEVQNPGFQWKGKSLRFTAVAPVTARHAQLMGYAVIDFDETPFAYRILGYFLHYILLAVGLLVLGGFFYLWQSSKLQSFVGKEKKRYFTLFQETSDGILFLDQDGKIIRANQSALSCFEEAQENVLGRKLLGNQTGGVLFVPLYDYKQILRDTITGGEKFRSKAKLILKQERVKYVSFSSSPWMEENSGKGAIVIFQDITEDVMREEELKHFQNQLREENQQLQKQIVTDPLTHCLNKHYLQHFLTSTNLRWASIEGCSMLLLDIDNFKAINDEKGHLAGDILLQSFAQFLIGFFRRSDKIVRYGGDEFIVLLPRTDLKSASRIAANMIEALRKISFDNIDHLSVSVGVSQLNPGELGKEWLARADAALYDAKHRGKNTFRAHDINELEILN